MKKDPQVFLKHILESVEWIEQDTLNLSKEQFLKNVPIQDAVIRRLEIIGEAINNLPSDFKKENPDIPWQDVSDTRNRLIHGYFGIEVSLVWSIVQNDIPPLKKQITKLLQQHH